MGLSSQPGSENQMDERTMVLQLLLPESVYEVALQIVRCMLEERSIATLLANFRIAFT